MIAFVDEGYITHDPTSENMDHAIFLCRLLEYGHYIDATPKVMQVILDFVNDHGTNYMVSIFSSCSNEQLSPTEKVRNWLSTYKIANLNECQKRALFFQPSELLVENAPNEWNVYKKIIKAYTKERTYKDLVEIINRAVNAYTLVPENAGGSGNIITMFDMKDNGEYCGQYKNKCCVIFDRDTNDDSYFDENKNRLFEKFAEGNTADTLTEEDAYALQNQGEYYWHMWYKRAIENYFPKAQYEALGVDMSDVNEVNYDYYRFVETNKERSYKKALMQKIGKGMSYIDYENNVKKFKIGNGEYSEMLLLLHKIAKIV